MKNDLPAHNLIILHKFFSSSSIKKIELRTKINLNVY